MLIVFKFPYNFFLTTSLSVHSEILTDSDSYMFTKVNYYPVGLVSGWVTSKIHTT